MHTVKTRRDRLTNTDKLISKKIAQVNKLLTVLNKCKISSENHKSSRLPFFSRDYDPAFFFTNFKCINEYKIPNKLNRNIKFIFQLLADGEKEIYIGEWTIMSLKQCTERYKDFCENGQHNVFDIGYRYLGMGHIEVISCDLNTHLLFYRPDGGSNGYDRYDNYQNVIKNGSEKYEKFYFSKWFYNINLV